MKEIFLISALAIFSFLPQPSRADVWSNAQKLRKKLLKDYNKNISPHGSFNGSTAVQFGMILKEALLDEGNQVFTATGFVLMIWRDNRLKWDPSDFGHEFLVHFELEELWKPDLVVVNAAKGADTNHFGRKLTFSVHSDGVVTLVSTATMSVPCVLNLKYWPFDVHQCKIILMSGTHDGFEVNVQLFRNKTEIDTRNFVENDHMWRVLEAKMERLSLKLDEANEVFINLDFLFTIKRNSPMFGPFVIVPALGIPIFLMIQFVLPVDHPKRLLIGFVSALLAMMELLFLKFSLPKIGTSVPLIVSYYSECFLVVILTVLLSAVLGRLTHPTNPLLDFPPPETVKTVVTGPLATVLRVQLHASKVGLSGNAAEDVEAISDKLPNYSHEWLLVAKVVDRICSILFLCIFIFSLFCFIAPIH